MVYALFSFSLNRPVLFIVCFLTFAGTATAAEQIVLLPQKFTLSDAEARQRVLVEQQDDGQYIGQVTEGVTFSSSDPKSPSSRRALPAR